MPNAQREVIEPLIGNAETVNTVKSVTMDGVKYSVGDCVAIGIKNGLLEFALLTKVLNINMEYKFLCANLETLYCAYHFHTYVVRGKSTFLLLMLSIYLICFHWDFTV